MIDIRTIVEQNILKNIRILFGRLCVESLKVATKSFHC